MVPQRRAPSISLRQSVARGSVGNLTKAVSPRRFLVETITGSDPLLDLRSHIGFGTVAMHTDVSETARIGRSPPLTAMHLHRVRVQAPNESPSAADIVHLGRARIPPWPLQLALPDAASFRLSMLASNSVSHEQWMLMVKSQQQQ
ncbi:uncharacterized protein BDW43DRAFT_309636 [Aspergillus alliaceus]|uniref:uncharacterized protein n=1 Tax=Petromyces alliaceus TaxID=209559 RepID=UPI0012A60F5B|nr:uncharacterized protein BDW43DRAFT_309636 [Aspergillus alliaceus]KAB8235270.1 hypothetical protein BDW43DRAFT_309636 [Aspergillus alliaceus]